MLLPPKRIAWNTDKATTPLQRFLRPQILVLTPQGPDVHVSGICQVDG
jgi:hypothetical protein